MSIFFKARGSNSFGLFIIRLVLGTYTLILGIQQANNIERYIGRVKALGTLDPNISFIVGFVLPFTMIVFGSLYIIGFFTPITSFVLAVIMIFKIIVRGVIVSEGIPFNKDIILLACFLLTLFTGAGVISFDALLDKKKKKIVTAEPPKVITPEPVVEPVIPPPVTPPPPPNENIP